MTNPKNQNTANAQREAETTTPSETTSPAVPSPQPRDETTVGRVRVKPAWPSTAVTIEDFTLGAEGHEMTRSEAEALQELLKERGVRTQLVIEDVK